MNGPAFLLSRLFTFKAGQLARFLGYILISIKSYGFLNGLSVSPTI